MYEQMRTDMLLAMAGKIQEETMALVISLLDRVSESYEVRRVCTELTVQEVVPQAVKSYVVSRAIEGLSPKTTALYLNVLQQFFETVKKPYDSVTANDIRVWLYHEQNRVSKRTAQLYRVIINSFYKWCVNEQRIQKSPSSRINPIKYERKQRRAMDQMELERIRSVCSDCREKALVELFYSTGCRVSEVVSAKKSDINWQTGEMIVMGKGSKERIVYLNAKAMLTLQTYLDSRDDNNTALFVGDRAPHTALKKSGLERIVRIISERAGMDITPHIFRHTTATVALQSGMPVQDVQRMLGHTKLDTTMIYAEVSQDSVKMMHKRCVV